ncbi:NACHT domain- and WD repeat-containing protein 1-like [Dreissena polymorpha]|uniref:NACHT domain- and WD repeat-containing protein 1-like n=1 Tax=Dreissena polymorpha TaxID=45954 RepID=UPI002264F5F4|nr:NACHT domain- and WD repeat-containing protein 1-like [Dreissena polymorpha]
MLRELKEHRMERRLHSDQIFHYNVHWVGPEGIDPDTSEEHRKYLARLCKDFTDNMISLTTQAIRNRYLLHDKLTEECLQHIRLCQSKCAEFHGRTETLERIESYLLDTSTAAPLVVHGISGTGKTSILAMAAKLCKTWLAKTPKLVLRFLGTTVASSSVLPLLQSLVHQLSMLDNQSLQAGLTVDLLKDQLNLLLKQGMAECPLVVILDSLDQLDTSHNGRSLMWLPVHLPPHCKIIVSSLPEEKYEAFPALKKLFPDAERFIQVPELGERDAHSIVSSWAEKRNRKLTPPQMDLLLSTFRKCPTPLFLKLSFDEAMLWRSFDPPSRTVLQTTVRTAVDFLFGRLEKLHGRILVCRALGYLTLANNGITEAELDDVLYDVYTYWTPPMRRLPPLLLVRIRTDIDQYIVERGADGARVLNWYHRQFTEAAHERYCADDAQNKGLHGNLADFFAGTWAKGRKKPYTNAKGEVIEGDRYVTSQPLLFGEDDYNIRALNNLPYHRLHAGHVDLLKKECLANVHFCVAKLHALPVEALLDDFTAAKAAFPGDSLIKNILEALLLSRKGLQTDPVQFVPQLLGRLEDNEATAEFKQRLREYSSKVWFEPDVNILERPGGQLLHIIHVHTSSLDLMTMTSCGTYVITVGVVGEIKIWNMKVEPPRLLREVTTGKGQCRKVALCHGDEWVAIEVDKVLKVEELQTGKHCVDIPFYGDSWTTTNTFCAAGKRKETIVKLIRKRFYIYDVTNGSLLQTLTSSSDEVTFNCMSKPSGRDRYVGVTDGDQYFLCVLDLDSMTLMPWWRGFEKIHLTESQNDVLKITVFDISPEETHVVYTNRFKCEIVFADFKGNRLRSVPSDRHIYSMNYSSDGRYIYYTSRFSVVFVNSATLQEEDCLEHKIALLDARTVDMFTVVTITKDNNLRVWDRSRDKKRTTDRQARTLAPITYIV